MKRLTPTKFGTRLALCRKLRDMTQVQLADKAKISPSWISHFENGRRMPSLQIYAQLIQALGCTEKELLFS